MRTRSLQKLQFLALVLIVNFAVSVGGSAQANNLHSNGLNTTIHGNPPSVTSFGFGGHPGFHGVPASVTSPNFGNTPFQFHQPLRQRPIFSSHRRHDRGFPFYSNVIAVPYAYPVYVDDPGVDNSVDDSMEEEDYRGGPTIFDRRGAGAQAYPRPGRSGQDEDYRSAAPPEPAPEAEPANQPRTVLVFKDGSHREVLNYAIVGSTLFDLSDGLTRKVALAELDLPATVKQNDDRGVEFQLPASAKSN